MTNFLLTREELKEIASNLFITDHAKERMKERLNTEDVEIIKKHITHPYLAWRNYDKAINIAIDKYTCMIIEKADNGYVLVTIKEASKNGVTTDTKFSMAFSGKCLKPAKGKTRKKNSNKKRRK